MTDVINMKDVGWVREKKTILQNVNWEVSKGQHWAVLGLNGSGKTTLLNMVNGYIWPTTGTVSILGNLFGKTNIIELRKSIGWVSSSLQERIQSNQATEDIVVSGKYASIGLYDDPTKEDFEDAYEIMKNIGCGSLIGRVYATCSSGEKQKLLIARGLMANPKLLILDEPSNGLDFISREELMETIKRLSIQPDAPTIILVTHHIEEILPMFTHTLLMKQGTVFDKGERETIFTNQSMSAFFDKEVQVNWNNNRAWMTTSE